MFKDLHEENLDFICSMGLGINVSWLNSSNINGRSKVMTRFVGSIVVAMFSLYGLAKFVSLHVVPSKGN